MGFEDELIGNPLGAGAFAEDNRSSDGWGGLGGLGGFSMQNFGNAMSALGMGLMGSTDRRTPFNYAAAMAGGMGNESDRSALKSALLRAGYSEEEASRGSAIPFIARMS